MNLTNHVACVTFVTGNVTGNITSKEYLMSDRVTMADVAREAGVSKMTVSRVINNKGEISPATRKHVLAVIDQLNYHPSAIARGLATKRTATLGLVVPDISNPFFSDIARGVEDKAYTEGYNVFLCSTYEDLHRELAVLKSLEEKRVDGLISCSSRLDDETLGELLDRFPAAVLVNRWLSEYDVGAVRIDNEAGGRMATEHLLQAGHRGVGFLTGPATSYAGQIRVRGYRATIGAADVPYNPAWERPCSPNVEGGREAARGLLADHPELTALLCYNDLVAVGVLQVCADEGRRVPDDLAIVSFDDIPLASLVVPSLTTLRAPRFDLGIQAMRLLLARIDDHAEEWSQEIILQPEIIVRASAP
jgi:LacI family transcriptional regulator